jgi:hypothetical protein
MDDTWKTYLSSFILTTALLGSLASAVDLEYITPEQSSALADQFSTAQLTDADQSTISHKPTWTCDMYGMRTKLQVQRGLKLYDFSKDHGSLKNTGAQPVENYSYDKDALVGKTSRLQDRIRMTASGQLISQLSVVNTTPNTIIAYSVCH